MLEIKELEVSVGSFHLGPLSLEINDSEYFVIMGPTGSGKSLLLKSICGLTSITTGRILVSGRDITGLPPGERGLGYVPQNSALFPNMSVRKNISFPMEVRRKAKQTILKKIDEIAEMLDITSLLERSPATLSGGESQKAALARALASEPDILIFDEPVSAVDEPTRVEICRELVRIQKELGITTVHVCHSLVEARAVSDRVGILLAGKMSVSGSLADITSSLPENRDVRRLLGEN